MYEVYVPLAGQSDAWQTVDAVHVHGQVYRLIGEMPEDEQWLYSTGQMVECERQAPPQQPDSEETVLVARKAVVPASL
ncbi:hypothetical protein A11A3_04530 [Alcanivorax hongdengensis A-11-3]|uniref:Uncharacterized protein n=1 Tax=Alcanivorax hongdengensis A-11-3 TaxID=1177179 RepID=L0WDU1_9GAMM|nr:hypothetical protein [Alcanivorax hongdengensis]EKF75216.1 hypothetical protein A11A3_04530 [Alcanivorax hongdengensis A-11-3]